MVGSNLSTGFHLLKKIKAAKKKALRKREELINFPWNV